MATEIVTIGISLFNQVELTDENPEPGVLFVIQEKSPNQSTVRRYITILNQQRD